jgi:hypothetical protein
MYTHTLTRPNFIQSHIAAAAAATISNSHTHIFFSFTSRSASSHAPVAGHNLWLFELWPRSCPGAASTEAEAEWGPPAQGLRKFLNVREEPGSGSYPKGPLLGPAEPAMVVPVVSTLFFNPKAACREYREPSPPDPSEDPLFLVKVAPSWGVVWLRTRGISSREIS